MAGSHIDLRKRNAAFASKVGKVNKLAKDSDLASEKKAPINKWVVGGILFLVLGGVIFELLQAVYNAFFAVKPLR
ncbi:hypothetical protein JCM8547_007830 [Rhodosporidiobolus lusitaniae]